MTKVILIASADIHAITCKLVFGTLFLAPYAVERMLADGQKSMVTVLGPVDLSCLLTLPRGFDRKLLSAQWVYNGTLASEPAQ